MAMAWGEFDFILKSPPENIRISTQINTTHAALYTIHMYTSGTITPGHLRGIYLNMIYQCMGQYFELSAIPDMLWVYARMKNLSLEQCIGIPIVDVYAAMDDDTKDWINALIIKDEAGYRTIPYSAFLLCFKRFEADGPTSITAMVKALTTVWYRGSEEEGMDPEFMTKAVTKIGLERSSRHLYSLMSGETAWRTLIYKFLRMIKENPTHPDCQICTHYLSMLEYTDMYYIKFVFDYIINHPRKEELYREPAFEEEKQCANQLIAMANDSPVDFPFNRIELDSCASWLYGLPTRKDLNNMVWVACEAHKKRDPTAVFSFSIVPRPWTMFSLQQIIKKYF